MRKPPYYPYGYGHLIESPAGSHGFRTILAYNSEGHGRRMNYYSNPDVMLPNSGTPTGVAGVANNARVLRQNIATFARLGDESGYCPTATTPTPDSGSVTSPNYPSNYPANVADNSTLIQVNAGSRIELNIEDLDIDCSCYFSCDYIKGIYFTNS